MENEWSGTYISVELKNLVLKFSPQSEILFDLLLDGGFRSFHGFHDLKQAAVVLVVVVGV